MAPHLSLDTKDRLIKALEDGKKVKEVASFFGVHFKTVGKLRKRFKEDGSVNRKKGSGGRHEKRFNDFLANLDKQIKATPKMSMRKMVRKMTSSPRTLRNAVKELGYKSYTQPVTQLVTEAQKQMRAERCKQLLSIMKTKHEVIFFTDEKVFVQDAHVNRCNNRVLARNPDERDDFVMFRSKNPIFIIIFGLVASDSRKMPLIPFPPRFRPNCEGYLEVLEKVKDWILAKCPEARGEEEGKISPDFKFMGLQHTHPGVPRSGRATILRPGSGIRASSPLLS